MQHIKTYVAVVEDDDSLRNSLARLLRASGHQPITYANAETFLADDARPRFDCLIVDIQLGGLSGLELIRHLVDAGNTTPLIVMTAQDEPDGRAMAIACGCAAFLRKSDPGERVLEAISHALGAAN